MHHGLLFLADLLCHCPFGYKAFPDLSLSVHYFLTLRSPGFFLFGNSALAVDMDWARLWSDSPLRELYIYYAIARQLDRPSSIASVS